MQSHRVRWLVGCALILLASDAGALDTHHRLPHASPAPIASSPAQIASACGSLSTVLPDTMPAGLVDHAMIYDPVRDEIVAFGGTAPNAQLSTDVWILHLAGTPAWVRVPNEDGPSPLNEPVVIHDSARDRMVAWSGGDDVWTFDLSTRAWTDVVVGGGPVASLGEASAIYDATRDRMIVFTGSTNEVWALSFAGSPAWTQLAPTGALPVRYRQTAIYDAPGDRMILFGGYLEDGTFTNEVWSLSLAGAGAWSQLSPSGTAPVGRAYHKAIFDAPRARMVVFGGQFDGGGGNVVETNEVWTLSLGSSPKWTKLAPSGVLPAATVGHGLAYDSSRQRLVAFGGLGAPDQVWALTLATSPTWSMIIDPAQPPMPRRQAVAVFDGVRHRMLLYGGQSNVAFPMNDVWALSTTGSASWTRLTPTGAGPVRTGHAAALDSVRSRLVVFGGSDGGHDQNDVWALALSGTPAWSKLSPSGTKPSPRQGARAIYDPGRDRIVIYGGVDSTGTLLGDVWALSLSGSGSWSQLTPAGVGPHFAYAAAIYDRPRDRMLVVSGTRPPGEAPAWQLSFAGSPAWTALAPVGGTPDATAPCAVFDGRRNRMVLASEGTDVRALPLGGTQQWLGGLIPGFTVDRHDATAIMDLDGDRVLLVGGGDGEHNDVRALSFPAATFRIQVGVVGNASSSTVSVTPDDCVAAGTTATLTPVPAPGYVFRAWSGDASGSANPLSLAVQQDRVVFAAFGQAPPTCGGWRRESETTDLPLDEPAMAYDPPRQRLVATGRSSTTGQIEVWSLDLVPALANWQKLTTSGGPPSYTSASDFFQINFVYDRGRDRMLFIEPSGSFGTGYVLWALSLGATPTWTQLSSNQSFGFNRYFGTIIYDPVRDRLVAYGGREHRSGPASTVSVLPLSPLGANWTQLAIGNPPPARYGHTAVYDASRDQMVVFGGFSSGSTSSSLTDVWALSLADPTRWDQLFTYCTPPAAGGYAAAVYDSVRDRMVVFGGTNKDFSHPYFPVYGPAVDGVSALSLRAVHAWTTLAVDGLMPGPMQRMASAYDPVNDRWVVSNGYGNGATAAVLRHDTYALSFGGGLWVDVSVLSSGGGSVTRSPAGLCVAPGSQVTLTAVPDGGYEFVRWMGDTTGDVNPLTFTLTRSVAVTAIFRDLTNDVPAHDLVTDVSIFPNPVRGLSQIDFAVARAGHVTLALYDLTGRRISVLADGAYAPGRYVAKWGARGTLAPGVYWLRMSAPDRSLRRSVVVLR